MKGAPRTARSMRKAKVGYKQKPFKFPSGMIMVQDTREQTSPLLTRLPKGLVLASDTLKDGDFSIRGHEKTFCIERKMISDLISYCTTERDTKTIKKMERFREMEWVGLVIEARESDLYRPYEWSSVSPEVIRQSVVSFSVRYGVHIYISDSQEKIVRWILDHMIKYYRIKREL